MGTNSNLSLCPFLLYTSVVLFIGSIVQIPHPPPPPPPPPPPSPPPPPPPSSPSPFPSFMHVRFFFLCTPFYWDTFMCYQYMFFFWSYFPPSSFFPMNVCPKVKKKGAGRLCMFIAQQDLDI